MNYNSLWKCLDDSLTDIRKLGGTIPPEVMRDLQSAKTMMQIVKTDPSRVDFFPQIEIYLGNVEAYIIYAVKDKLGQEHVEDLMQKLKKAREPVPEGEAAETDKESYRFVPGLPRGVSWIRLQISKEIPQDMLESLAAEEGLNYKLQKDGYLLVYGSEEKIKGFVRKVAES